MKNLMKNTMLMVVALVLAVPNAYAVKRQETKSAAQENQDNAARAAAEKLFETKTTQVPSAKVEATSTDSFATRFKKAFTSAKTESKAETNASEQAKPENEQAKSTSSSSTASAQGASAPAASLKSKIYNTASVAAQGAKSLVAGAAQRTKSFMTDVTSDVLNDMTDGAYSMDSAQVAAKKATILANLIPDMYNPVSNSTAVALTGAAAAIALAYWYAPEYVASSCFDAANMVCQTTASDLCGVCEPVVEAVGMRQGDFWGAMYSLLSK